jgi:hypothetical protein
MADMPPELLHLTKLEKAKNTGGTGSHLPGSTLVGFAQFHFGEFWPSST